ncbi:MAG: hydantoinase B/oxoprolinase family protein [Prosthecochloris sp.]|nr:hydantoinase B/oxoprolinase family protein [Prosthecochloris sp.]
MNSSRTSSSRWNFAIDRGGTFTDIVGIDPEGAIHTRKVLSICAAYPDAGIHGIMSILGNDPSEPLDARQVDTIRIGTTVATNALLEGKGAPLALCITAGFEDLMEIGNGTREELFSLAVTRHAPLYRAVRAIGEAVDAGGRVMAPMDEEHALRQLLSLRSEGYDHLAIVLKHAWINPEHERRLAVLAREKAGFTGVTLSHEVMPLCNMLKRGQTTLIEAYLAPVLYAYIESIRRLAGNVHLEFMQSSGGLVPAGAVQARDTILSGPAGGVNALAKLSDDMGMEQSIGFDMGGTSTDVSRYGGRLEHIFENTVSGVPFYTDMLDVETVAAGGGSILSFDGMRMLVGPQSAGSDPGPACYGLGGPLTVTDANLVLGRIVPETMPRTFGPGGNQPLDIETTRRQFDELACTINRETGSSYTLHELAAGYLRIANEIMCRALKKISVSRGYDIREHGMVCFGGAATQHACDIARILGIGTIVVHPLSSVLSAYGIALSDAVERTVRPILEPLSAQLLGSLQASARELAAPLYRALGCRADDQRIVMTAFLDLRPPGTDSWLSLECGRGTPNLVFDDDTVIRKRFLQTYNDRFGFAPPSGGIEAVNFRLEIRRSASIRIADLKASPTQRHRDSHRHTRVWTGEGFEDVPLLDPASLEPGTAFDGPAMVAGSQLTLFVRQGFRAAADNDGRIVLTDRRADTHGRTARKRNMAEHADPVLLEVFNNLFMNVAEQMGYRLANTAHSVNMKERHDFSCALFDSHGRLVAHAPHIPVHLGAMEATISHIIGQEDPSMQPGDMFVANNPHEGGSHLPDITVVAPVFCGGTSPAFYVANRGHHADIGGMTPGSMPPSSRSIDQEGVVISSFLLVRNNLFRERELVDLLSRGPWPARNLQERISDLRAQVASNRKGISELTAIIESQGYERVTAYMHHLQEHANHSMQNALRQLAGTSGKFHSSFTDVMDNGARISVILHIEAPEGRPASLHVDFTGTSPQDPSNINAPEAVTRAAVLYSLRCLIDDPVPLNAGCLAPVTITIPRGSLLKPSPEAAVAVGNVETSQRVVDVLLGALGKAAASQGTMNNLLFGRADNSGAQYYETIPGGSGAVEGADGASGVQVHMTNTRITDPEILEHRFDGVRVTGFSLRRGSGGNGRWKGGDGVERRLEFSSPMLVSLLTERRKHAPFGLNGGGAGSPGTNLLLKPDGFAEELSHRAELMIREGETVVIRTPGGGGYGRADY